MKFCTSEQNLVTNILKINLSPHVTSMCVQSVHNLEKVRIYRLEFTG